jgi:tRNA 2-thiouridine synthesizing protein D
MAVVVTTPPYDNLTTTTINIIKAALANNICIVGVFFYQKGVLNAAKNLSFPNDEFQTQQHWQSLAKEHKLALYLCSTAAEKHGLVVDNFQHEKDELALIDDSFILAGLGELVTLTNEAERVLQL